MYGKTIGPSAVHDQLMPVTILRRSLKYVLRANELAEVVKPTPAPKKMKFSSREFFDIKVSCTYRTLSKT